MAIQKHSGWMMEWTSYIHNAVGLILGWKPLSELVKAGVWNSIDHSFERIGSILVFILWFYDVDYWTNDALDYQRERRCDPSLCRLAYTHFVCCRCNI